MLWIALHLPALSLESFAATLPEAQTPQALALVDAHRIASANACAQALGVKAGLKRATALALAPQLLLGQANAHRDAQALMSVAHAALAFTPAVSLLPPSGVLLEVQASLRYFGGLAALMRRLRAAMQPLNHALHCVSAPTAQGAAVLSQLHDGLHCADLPALHRALSAAPLWLLSAGQEHWDTLQGMGLRTIADVQTLPRSGLARRFGVALLHELDCATGVRPDPREFIALPPAFSSQLELFARADTTEQVLYGAQVLLSRLVAWLSGQHAFVRRFTLQMKHEPRWRHDANSPAETLLEVALAEPSRDAGHLLALLRERLGALQLAAPTLELGLQADDISRQAPPNTELFPTPQSEHAGLTRLIERLQARLGREQVQCLVAVQDHRPERATEVRAAEPAMWRAVEARMAEAMSRGPAAQGALQPAPELPGAALAAGMYPMVRPVWLLPEAQALQERDSRPLLEGKALQLLSGPERVESGWWDHGLVERDYFIAQTADGALLWLYRKRLPMSAPGEGWFLHGRFG